MAESLLVSSSSSSTTLSFYCSSGIRSTKGTSTKAVVVPLCRKPKQRCPSTTSTTATSLSSVRLGLSPTTSLSSSSSFNANSNVEPAFSSPFFHCRSGPTPLSALDSGIPHPQGPPVESETFRQWDSLTTKFSASANIPFLLLQLPQIILNARNLLSGNNSALSAVPWLGMLTGMLGNLSLLSYFAKKREKEAVVVQTLGVVSTYVVITQLAIAEAMPLAHFTVTSVVVAAGLVLNFMNYFGLLNSNIWRFWEDFITIGGLSVMWSTFVPYIPSSILPGLASFGIALAAVIMARMGKLSEGGVKFVGVISGWTATLLFMWMPVSQMWTNFLCPDNIKGLSASSMLLAMIGNGLMIPRALFIRDFMWFTGSAWAVLFYGYGNILCLYCCNCISREFFLAATIGFLGWIGMALWRDSAAYGHRSPLRSVKELVFGP